MLSLVALSISSCNFLDVVPPEQPNLKDATSNYDRTLGFLHSCYKGTTDIDLPTAYLGEINSSTDEFTLPASWTEGSWYTYATNTASATNQNWLWGQTYRYIGQCLLFMKELDKVKADYITEDHKKLWKAECNFLIAYYHFITLRRYGPIPITDTYIPMDTDPNKYNGRFHFDYCVKWIADKFDEAAKDLPAVRTESNEWGRATSTMCKAYKARLLLYAASPLWNGEFPFKTWKNKNFETPGYGFDLVSSTYDPQKWEIALTACKDALQFALNEGGRELYKDTQYYARQEIPLPYVPGITDGDLPENEKLAFQENVMKMRYAVSTRESEGNREIIWGCASSVNLLPSFPHRIIQQNNGNWSNGYSGIGPTLFTMENFYTKDGKLPAKDPNFTPEVDWFESSNLPNRGDIIKLNANREPRFYAWLAFDGGDYGSKFQGGSPLKLQMRNGNLNGYNPSLFNRDNSPTGFLSQKYVDPRHEFLKAGGQNQGTSAPIIHYRLAELYLNAAECCAALGKTAEAIEYLNPIRKRAGVPELKAEDVTADMTIMDWVKAERFIELWYEGQRFFDVRRWCEGKKYFAKGQRKGLNANVLNPSFEEFNKPTILPHPFAWDDRMYLNPIFYNEVYKNPQMVQAPGY